MHKYLSQESHLYRTVVIEYFLYSSNTNIDLDTVMNRPVLILIEAGASPSLLQYTATLVGCTSLLTDA